jgi:hypothetical protein
MSPLFTVGERVLVPATGATGVIDWLSYPQRLEPAGSQLARVRLERPLGRHLHTLCPVRELARP